MGYYDMRKKLRDDGDDGEKIVRDWKMLNRIMLSIN